jgi:hypothetical protein
MIGTHPIYLDSGSESGITMCQDPRLNLGRQKDSPSLAFKLILNITSLKSKMLNLLSVNLKIEGSANPNPKGRRKSRGLQKPEAASSA